MKLALSLFIILTLSSLSSHAASVCVGASATGDGSGNDWNNQAAWSSLSFTRGNTYYLADGSYGGKTLSTATSSTTLITIQKATSSSHGTTTGWSDTYGDGQAEFTAQIAFTSSYWVFDGMTGGGPVNYWTNNFGFKITEARDTVAIVSVGNSATANSITIRHVDMVGKGSVATGGGSLSNDALAIYGDAGTTVSYAHMNGIGRCPFFFVGNSDTLLEYIYVEKFYGSASVHSEVMSSGQGLTGDTTFRYNLVTDIQSTGGLMWDNNTQTSAVFYVYGNVFCKPSGASWQAANGIIGGWTGGSGEECRNVLVYNNTFVDTEDGGEVFSTYPNLYSNLQGKNNLFYSVGNVGGGSKWTLDYNHFISTTTTGSNTTTGSGDPFTSMVGLDFRLTSNTTAGTDLGSPYNVDMYGITRTTWTRGAYEYVSPNITTVNATTVNKR